MVGVLLSAAPVLGFRVTFGDAYRDPRAFGKVGEDGPYGHPSSNHKKRLAVDLNVFNEEGRYLQGTEAEQAHSVLHDLWDVLGGARRLPEDLNHYEIYE